MQVASWAVVPLLTLCPHPARPPFSSSYSRSVHQGQSYQRLSPWLFFMTSQVGGAACFYLNINTLFVGH